MKIKLYLQHNDCKQCDKLLKYLSDTYCSLCYDVVYDNDTIIPIVVLLDSKDREIDRIIGFSSVDDKEHLDKIVLSVQRF